MAEGDDTSPDRFHKRITFSDDSENEEHVKLDLGIKLTTKNYERQPTNNSTENNFGASSK